jgi:hypothetical protein
MHSLALKPDTAWAEDRATQRCDPSADPGAKTDGAAGSRPLLPIYPHHRNWHQSDKPSRHNAAMTSARHLSPLANANRSTFQFPLNQDRTTDLGIRLAI